MMQISAIVDSDTAFDIALVCVKKGFHFTLSAVTFHDDDEDEEEE